MKLLYIYRKNRNIRVKIDLAKLEKSIHGTNKGSDNIEDISPHIFDQQSHELIIAFVGPIGSDISNIKTELFTSLRLYGYEVIDIKVSDLIKEYGKLDEVDEKNKYALLQDKGNELRKRFGENALSQAVLQSLEFNHTLVMTTMTDCHCSTSCLIV